MKNRPTKQLQLLAFTLVELLVTISIGYTCITPGDVGSSAFGRADEALYIAKQRGRNQVQWHESLTAQSVFHSNASVTAEVELF